MLYVPLNFGNGQIMDSFVGSGSFVKAIAQNESDRTKQQTPAKIFKIDDPPGFQIQVANDQLEKPTATATLKFGIGHHIFTLYITFRREEESERAQYKIALQETQNRVHRHYIWPHPFSPFDKASQKCSERNEC